MSNYSPNDPPARSNGKEPVPRPRVVVLGAGFAGLWAAKHLTKAAVDVWIVDRNNYHTFFPLLYQIAAAELTPVKSPNRCAAFFGTDPMFTLSWPMLITLTWQTTR